MISFAFEGETILTLFITDYASGVGSPTA